MAQKVRIELVDDLDGSAIAEGSGETLTFGIDGAQYELDLSDKNAKKLRDMLAPYIAASRRVGGAKRGRPKGSGTTARRDPEQTKAIKAWGEANGFKVPARGRLSKELTDAFEAAHQG